jgi:predicted nucleic acid-binding Zn ribbon protein
MADFKKSKRHSHLTSGADVLQALLSNGKSQIGDGFLRWRLEQAWPEVVGDTIAAQTLPCALEFGTLYIWVKHSAWMQQLWFFQDMIRDKTNAYLGKAIVKEVKFTLNRRASVQSKIGDPQP